MKSIKDGIKNNWNKKKEVEKEKKKLVIHKNEIVYNFKI